MVLPLVCIGNLPQQEGQVLQKTQGLVWSQGLLEKNDQVRHVPELILVGSELNRRNGYLPFAKWLHWTLEQSAWGSTSLGMRTGRKSHKGGCQYM